MNVFAPPRARNPFPVFVSLNPPLTTPETVSDESAAPVAAPTWNVWLLPMMSGRALPRVWENDERSLMAIPPPLLLKVRFPVLIV